MLKKRGITDDTRRRFALGYAPDSRGRLRTALHEFGDAMLVEAGLLIQVEGKEPYDRFRGRLTIPIRDPRGRVIAFGARVIGEGEPKYLNSPDTPLFDKGRTLYNLDRAAPAARKAGRVIVVEGYLDVIALAQAGIDEAVAPLGTALTEAQLERLWRVHDVPIVCLDGDGAGQKAAIRAGTRALPMLAPGRSLSFVTLPDGQDPDDMVRSRGRDAFETLLSESKPLVDLIWRSELTAAPLVTPEERAGLRFRLRTQASTIQDPDVRSQYLAAFNERVWDLFHPEKPTTTFRQFGKQRPLPPPVSPRLLAIAGRGIDQVSIIPALFNGLLRFPSMIAPLSEVLVRIPVHSIKLRQMRERLLDAALGSADLETDQVLTILRLDALEPLVRKLEEVKLAFSFLSHNADRDQACRDIALVAEKLEVGPALDAELEEAKMRYAEEWNDAAFAEYTRLLIAKQQVDKVFMDALLPDEEPAA